MTFVVAAREREVEVTDALGDGTDRAVADRAPVDLHARRDLCAGPAEKDLVRDVQLRAVDGPLLDGDAQLARKDDDRVARDPFEDVRGHRWRHEDAVADHEDVRAAALRHVTVRGEEDRLVRLVVVRLVDGERGVDVRAGELAARRDRVVRGAPPARRACRQSAGREICADRERVDPEPIAEARERDLHGARRLEGEWPDVHVASEAVLP